MSLPVVSFVLQRNEGQPSLCVIVLFLDTTTTATFHLSLFFIPQHGEEGLPPPRVD